MTDAEHPWFAPKRYGFGTGLPIAWQGWVPVGLHVAAVIGAALVVQRLPMTFAAVIVLATAGFVLVCAFKRGGWRWRWGEDG